MNVSSAVGGPAVVSYPSDTQLLITRRFRAPRTLVFACLTQPEHVRNWWGDCTDSLIVCEIDFRVGGRWHYVLAGRPGGPDHSFSGEFLAIEEPSRLLNTESYDNIPGAEYVVEVTLEEDSAGVTTLTSLITYPAQAMRDGHVASGMEYGMNISYDRLDALLARLAS